MGTLSELLKQVNRFASQLTMETSDITAPLGAGSFCTVFPASLSSNNLRKGDSDSSDVAVSECRSRLVSKSFSEYVNRSQERLRIRKVRSPFILPTIYYGDGRKITPRADLNLGQYIRANEGLHIKEMVAQLVLALAALHKCNLVHTDIRPENFLVTIQENQAVYLQLGDLDSILAVFSEKHEKKKNRLKNYWQSLQESQHPDGPMGVTLAYLPPELDVFKKELGKCTGCYLKFDTELTNDDKQEAERNQRPIVLIKNGKYWVYGNSGKAEESHSAWQLSPEFDFSSLGEEKENKIILDKVTRIISDQELPLFLRNVLIRSHQAEPDHELMREIYADVDLKAVDCYALGVTLKKLAESSDNPAVLGELIDGLMKDNPLQRFTIKEALQNTYFGSTEEEQKDFFAQLEEKYSHDIYVGNYLVRHPEEKDVFFIIPRDLQEINSLTQKIISQLKLFDQKEKNILEADVSAKIVRAKIFELVQQLSLVMVTYNKNKGLYGALDELLSQVKTELLGVEKIQIENRIKIKLMVERAVDNYRKSINVMYGLFFIFNEANKIGQQIKEAEKENKSAYEMLKLLEDFLGRGMVAGPNGFDAILAQVISTEKPIKGKFSSFKVILAKELKQLFPPTSVSSQPRRLSMLGNSLFLAAGAAMSHRSASSQGLFLNLDEKTKVDSDAKSASNPPSTR